MVKYGESYIGSTSSLTASGKYTVTGATFDFHVGPRFRVEAKKNPVYVEVEAQLLSFIFPSIDAIKYREIKLASADLLSIVDLNTTPEVYVRGYSAMTSTTTFDQKECYEFIYNIRRMSTPYVEGRTYRYLLTDSFVYDSESECYSKPQTIYTFRAPYTGRSIQNVVTSLNYPIFERILQFNSNLGSNFNLLGDLTYNPGAIASLILSLGTLDASIIGTQRTGSDISTIMNILATISGPSRGQANFSSLFSNIINAAKTVRTSSVYNLIFSNISNAVKTARINSSQSSTFTIPSLDQNRVRRVVSNQNSIFTKTIDTTLYFGVLQTISSYSNSPYLKFTGNGNYIVQLVTFGDDTKALRYYELSSDRSTVVSTNDVALGTVNRGEINVDETGEITTFSANSSGYGYNIYTVFKSTGTINTNTPTGATHESTFSIVSSDGLMRVYDEWNYGTNSGTFRIYNTNTNTLVKSLTNPYLSNNSYSMDIEYDTTNNRYWFVGIPDGNIRVYNSNNTYGSGTILRNVSLTGAKIDMDSTATYIATVTFVGSGSGTNNIQIFKRTDLSWALWKSFTLDNNSTIQRNPVKIKITRDAKRVLVVYDSPSFSYSSIAVFDLVDNNYVLQTRVYNYFANAESVDISDDKRYWVEDERGTNNLKVYTLR